MRGAPTRGLFFAVCIILLLSHSLASTAWGQGATSSINGIVQDTGGGIIPGATVVVTSTATGTKYETVTNTAGTFNVPALPAGTYTVTASLQGFKNAVITDVRAQPGVPTSVKAILEALEQ